LFYWGYAQSETKRVFFMASLGKRRAQPPRIRLATGRNRSISMAYMSHKIDQRQFFPTIGYHLLPYKTVQTDLLS